MLGMKVSWLDNLSHIFIYIFCRGRTVMLELQNMNRGNSCIGRVAEKKLRNLNCELFRS